MTQDNISYIDTFHPLIAKVYKERIHTTYAMEYKSGKRFIDWINTKALYYFQDHKELLTKCRVIIRNRFSNLFEGKIFYVNISDKENWFKTLLNDIEAIDIQTISGKSIKDFNRLDISQHGEFFPLYDETNYKKNYENLLHPLTYSNGMVNLLQKMFLLYMNNFDVNCINSITKIGDKKEMKKIYSDIDVTIRKWMSQSWETLLISKKMTPVEWDYITQYFKDDGEDIESGDLTKLKRIFISKVSKYLLPLSKKWLLHVSQTYKGAMKEYLVMMRTASGDSSYEINEGDLKAFMIKTINEVLFKLISSSQYTNCFQKYLILLKTTPLNVILKSLQVETDNSTNTIKQMDDHLNIFDDVVFTNGRSPNSSSYDMMKKQETMDKSSSSTYDYMVSKHDLNEEFFKSNYSSTKKNLSDVWMERINKLKDKNFLDSLVNNSMKFNEKMKRWSIVLLPEDTSTFSIDHHLGHIPNSGNPKESLINFDSQKKFLKYELDTENNIIDTILAHSGKVIDKSKFIEYLPKDNKYKNISFILLLK